MTETIWKFPLKLQDAQTVMMPEGAVPLSVAMQHGQLVLWARVAPAARVVGHGVFVRGTGHPLGLTSSQFVGTALDTELGLVWHVFA